MRVLIAEDDPVARRLLEVTLERGGYEVVVADDGEAAWRILSEEDPPRLVLLDWMMPGVDGVELCRRIRAAGRAHYTYVVFLTAKQRREDIVAGLDAGADDYLSKPYDRDELLGRLRTGARIVELEARLARKVAELADALAHVKQLQGLLPICMHCKRIRDDEDTWHRLETYIERHSSAMFTHSLCQDCLETHYPAEAADIEETPRR